MSRRFTAVFVSAAFAAFLVTGCATEREAQYTATGAGIGAVTGAILGAALGSLGGDAGEGAVIGSIFGGLAGASIGHNEYHLHRSEEEAARYYSYRYDREVRDLLRIEDAYARPGRVYAGDEVQLTMTYTLLTPYRSADLVHEVREVRYRGQIIGRPSVRIHRDGGTWTSTMPVRIPPDAEPGVYEVLAIAETDNAGDTRSFTFNVDRPPR